MAGRGPAPKKEHARPRDTARRTKPAAVVEADGELHGLDLPTLEEAWPPPTERWWDTWRRSAQAQTMTDTDWDFLLDTALLHARFWRGDAGVAAELRLRVAKFGATPEDRMRLRIQVGEPKPATPEAQSGTPKASRYSHLRVAE